MTNSELYEIAIATDEWVTLISTAIALFDDGKVALQFNPQNRTLNVCPVRDGYCLSDQVLESHTLNRLRAHKLNAHIISLNCMDKSNV